MPRSMEQSGEPVESVLKKKKKKKKKKNATMERICGKRRSWAWTER